MKARVTAFQVTAGSVLALRASAKEGAVRVEAVESVPIPADADSMLKAREQLAARGLLGLPAVLVLPPTQGFVCFHRPSVQDDRAVRETIRYELEEEVPEPVDGLALDFDYVEDGRSGPRVAAVGAAPAAVLDEQLESARGLGFAPVQVTVEGAALANAYAALGLLDGAQCVLGIHVSSGALQLVRLRGSALQEARMIVDEGASSTSNDELPSLARSSLLEAVISGDVERAYVSGPAARAAALADKVSRATGVPCAVAGTGRVAQDGLSKEEVLRLQEAGLPLVGAAVELLGLTVPARLNLLAVRQQCAGWLSVLRTPLRWAVVLFLVFLVVWSVEPWIGAWRMAGARQAMQSELVDLWTRAHPGEPLPADPVRTLKAEMAEGIAGRAGGPFHALETLRRLVGPLSEVRTAPPYRRIRIAAGEVDLEGTARSYVEVESLLALLGKESSLAAGRPEMSAESGTVTFKVRLVEEEP